MRILFVDDDRDLVDLLRYAFKREGHAVAVAYDAESAANVVQLEKPDVIVLDLNLPKRHGMDLLRDLRRDPDVAIIVLSAIGDEDHLVNALNLGADDYVVKPFRPRELKARVNALVRRTQRQAPTAATFRGTLSSGEITLDPQRREVTIGGRAVHLTHHEFALLHYLMLNREILVPVPDIIVNVWGFDTESSDNVVQVTMSRLRRKIETDPAHPRYLVNSPGEGYMFRDGA